MLQESMVLTDLIPNPMEKIVTMTKMFLMIRIRIGQRHRHTYLLLTDR